MKDKAMAGLIYLVVDFLTALIVNVILNRVFGNEQLVHRVTVTIITVVLMVLNARALDMPASPRSGHASLMYGFRCLHGIENFVSAGDCFMRKMRVRCLGENSSPGEEQEGHERKLCHDQRTAAQRAGSL